MKCIIKYLFFSFIIFAASAELHSQEKKDIHYFIKKAWENDSTIKQAKFDIDKYRNMEFEVISTYAPKINGITWLAPMYTVKTTDDPFKTVSDFNNWGPFYNLQLDFQEPIFTFTRVYTAIKAAQEGQNVARADVEITKWNVAKDIRLYYYGIIFGKTMLKTIDLADDLLTKAINAAADSLAQENGDVSIVDLSKLKYFYTQIPIYRSYINKSIDIAQQALFLSTREKLGDQDIPRKFDQEINVEKDFSYYLDLMLKNRPLLKKLNSGINATRDLVDLEYKSMLPALFIGGYLKFAVTPTVDMVYNRLWSNTFNTFNNVTGEGRGVDGGVAIGLFWQFDPVKAVAKALQKKADLDKLLEMHNYAMSGFPLQLDKALKDFADLKVKIDSLDQLLRMQPAGCFLRLMLLRWAQERQRTLWKDWALMSRLKQIIIRRSMIIINCWAIFAN